MVLVDLEAQGSKLFSERPVLIVDGMNLYLRSWASYPTMSAHGYQMGGCMGFMKTLGRILHEIQPAMVVVAWEGGGSQRRRSILPEYKLGRRAEKLNRFYGDDIPESEENRKHQLLTLISMLKFVPVCQVYASNCEGDDIISYLCRGPFRDRDKLIVSSDKDLYQLLNVKTQLYSLHKKKVVNEQDIFEEFRIKTHNFALAKALCGDVSDNVPGIKGWGFKTVAKKLPFLGGEQEILVQDVIDFSHSHVKESPLYKRIIESQDELRRNWKLVHLDGGMLSPDQISKIQHSIDTFEPHVDRIGFIKSLVKEGINDFDTEKFFYSFNSIDKAT